MKCHSTTTPPIITHHQKLWCLRLCISHYAQKLQNKMYPKFWPSPTQIFKTSLYYKMRLILESWSMLIDIFSPTCVPNLVTSAWKMSPGMPKSISSLNGPLCIYQWNFIHNSNISIEENAFKCVVWQMAAIFPQPQCVNRTDFCIILCVLGTILVILDHVWWVLIVQCLLLIRLFNLQHYLRYSFRFFSITDQ